MSKVVGIIDFSQGVSPTTKQLIATYVLYNGKLSGEKSVATSVVWRPSAKVFFTKACGCGMPVTEPRGGVSCVRELSGMMST